MQPGRITERITCASGTESQAAKRQKLEGGHVLKVNITVFFLICFKLPFDWHEFRNINYCQLDNFSRV